MGIYIRTFSLDIYVLYYFRVKKWICIKIIWGMFITHMYAFDLEGLLESRNVMSPL